MKTTRKGKIGLSKTITEALVRGYSVYLPFDEDEKTDLVVDRNGKLEKVQCKATTSDGKRVLAKARSTSSWSSKTKQQVKYTEKDIDWLVVYDFTSDRCYFIHSNYLGKGRNSISLRLVEPKSNQKKGIVWAKDFLEW